MDPWYTAKCVVCGASEAEKCPTCASTFHCSTKCHDEDDRVHKILCEKFVQFISRPPPMQHVLRPRPTRTSIIAILFPIHGKEPMLIWLDEKRMKKVDLDESENVVVSTTIFTGETRKYDIRVRYSKDVTSPSVRVASDGHDIMKWGLRDCESRGLAMVYTKPPGVLNTTAVETTAGKLARPWSGPIVVYGQRQNRGIRHSVDVAVADLSHVVTFFTHYFFGYHPWAMRYTLQFGGMLAIERTNPQLFSTMLEQHCSRRVKGVAIICTGNRDDSMKGEDFLPVEIPDCHPIFNHNEIKPTPVSKHLNLPILIRKGPPYASENESKGLVPFFNRSAYFLNVETDFSHKFWGYRGLPEKDVCGSETGEILVVRQDMKPITPHQVEALASFCARITYPDIERRRMKNPRMYQNEIEAENANNRWVITRTKFEAFFARFKEDKVQKKSDASWTNELSPYDEPLPTLNTIVLGATGRLAGLLADSVLDQ